MIGLSLSFCIADIARGKVDENEVEKIIAGTAFHSVEEFEQILSEYEYAYWQGLPDATEIARRFYYLEKIEQPRLMGLDVPNIAHGHWYDE